MQATNTDLYRQVLAKADLVAMAQSRTELKPTPNGELKGCCPFHKDDTPSFFVSPEKKVFICRGCGEGGTAIDFHALDNGFDRETAIADLAKKLGITGQSVDQKIISNTRLMDDMVSRYERNLKSSKRAIEYLSERGITPETIKKFRLGYSFGNDVPRDLLRAQRLEKIGVLNKHKESGALREFMARRLVIPIMDEMGNPIGLAGRALDDGRAPKYMNTKETDLFQKSKVLFGMDQAAQAIRSEGYAVLVEGYFDVITLHQHGLHNVCGVMGTAATNEGINKLWATTRRIVFCFDGDEAGIQASIRNIHSAAASMKDGREISVALLPDGMDPDEYVNEHGVEGMRALFTNSVPLSVFMATRAAREANLATPEGRAAYRVKMDTLADSFINAPRLAEEIRRETEMFAATFAAKQILTGNGDLLSEDEVQQVGKLMDLARYHQASPAIKENLIAGKKPGNRL